MKFYIILYLTIAFMFSQTIPWTPYMAEGGVQYTDVSSVEEEVQQQAQQIRQTDPTPSSFGSVIKSQVSSLIHTIIVMSTFSFEMPGAPQPVNDFVSGFFGILSVLFIVAVIREVMNLVPWV